MNISNWKKTLFWAWWYKKGNRLIEDALLGYFSYFLQYILPLQAYIAPPFCISWANLLVRNMVLSMNLSTQLLRQVWVLLDILLSALTVQVSQQMSFILWIVCLISCCCDWTIRNFCISASPAELISAPPEPLISKSKELFSMDEELKPSSPYLEKPRSGDVVEELSESLENQPMVEW